MVHFTKDSFVITIPMSEPLTGYLNLQGSLASVLMLIFAEQSTPNPDIIWQVANLMGSLSEFDETQLKDFDDTID